MAESFAQTKSFVYERAIVRGERGEGVVTVQVTLDETGKVIEATATSGPKSLRQFAEDAIKKSKFNPAKVNDQPVKSRCTTSTRPGSRPRSATSPTEPSSPRPSGSWAAQTCRC